MSFCWRKQRVATEWLTKPSITSPTRLTLGQTVPLILKTHFATHRTSSPLILVNFHVNRSALCVLTAPKCKIISNFLTDLLFGVSTFVGYLTPLSKRWGKWPPAWSKHLIARSLAAQKSIMYRRLTTIAISIVSELSSAYILFKFISCFFLGIVL